MNNIQIDIVSDIACPWCAIGYARLEQAMAQLREPTGEYEFRVEWHAFELDPHHSGEGEPILPALARKYGRSEEEMRANQDHLMMLAKGLGLNFEQLQQRKTCNTFDAHRLVKWARAQEQGQQEQEQQGRQTAMKMALFEAYFGKALDVSDPEVLLSCVQALGLDTEQARQVLASDQFVEAVREDEATYQQAGISSVPAFIINNKYLISGAQEPETLVQAIRQAGSESA